MQSMPAVQPTLNGGHKTSGGQFNQNAANSSAVLRLIRHHIRGHPAQSFIHLEQFTFAMEVTVYETQTLDGGYSLSLHMTLEATISQMVQQTVIATEGELLATSSTVSSATLLVATTVLSSIIPPVFASVEPYSFNTSSSSPQSSQSTPEGTPPSAAQMSTGSIVGIAVGSIFALVLLVTFLLFAFGFRIRQARRRSDTGITEHKKNQRAASVAAASQNGKAEL
ncbi:hypothetical protein LA080_006458 [Diaporthe eres]|nr:hypothetical protein LA080_006458 [Diaporthe eres]